MKKGVGLSYLRSICLVLLVLCAIALPSAAGNSFKVVQGVALLSAGLLLVGIILGIVNAFTSRKNKKTKT